jgi:hypothetical protein
MSVNLNSNIIKAVQPQVNRAPVSYNFPATIFAAGGGGGGASGSLAVGSLTFGLGGGGGGGSALVSASISVVPNITWTISVGNGGASNEDGQDTSAIVYNDDYSGLVTLKSQGGRKGGFGVEADGSAAGGNSGTGSVEFSAAVTSSYAGFTGGAESRISGRQAAGGGAGAGGNGGEGNPVSGGTGGNGGFSVQPAIIFNSRYVGAGGGGGTSANQVSGGTGGLQGGGAAFGGTGTGYAAGGGGGFANLGTPAFGPGGPGTEGLVVVRFIGRIGTQLNQYDIAVTNASSSYDSGTNTTTIIFSPGSGTFRYTAPFPYVPGN